MSDRHARITAQPEVLEDIMARCSVCLELVGEDADRSTGDPVCETCAAEHELRADAVAAAFMARPLPAGARAL